MGIPCEGMLCMSSHGHWLCLGELGMAVSLALTGPLSLALTGLRCANKDAVISVKPDGITEITHPAPALGKGTCF